MVCAELGLQFGLLALQLEQRVAHLVGPFVGESDHVLRHLSGRHFGQLAL